MIRLPDPPLTDGAVTLRGLTRDDLPAVVAACQDPEIGKNTSVPYPYGIQDGMDFLELQTAEMKEDRGIYFAIAASDDLERLLGTISIGFHQTDPFGEIGYWITPSARNNGVATKALVLLSRWGIPQFQLARLELRTLTHNAASQRVAEKAGFTREGLLRAGIVLKGRVFDVNVFSLVPADL